MKRTQPLLRILLFLLTAISASFAGGPNVVGGPNFGIDGKPFIWNPAAMPIYYEVDNGPLSSGISAATGLQRVQSMLGVWQAVPTAALSFSYAGPIAATGSFGGGDVRTIGDYNAVKGACRAGTQNPIIFDADGSLASALGLDDLVLGFAGPCSYNAATGYIDSASATLIGKWQDGVSNSSNYEVPSAVFDEVMVHEIGHFLGLDHSQINLSAYKSRQCTADELAGVPLMFPISFCNARSTFGLPQLSPDDIAWISKLYPSSTFASSYGTISGYILFPDAVSQVQGVNVIARRVDDPNTPENESRRIAISVVSGFLFTGFVGQNITEKYLPCVPASQCPPAGFLGAGNLGSPYGSRDPKLIGYYEIPVPPGDYTVEIENVDSAFDGGSSVGPLSPPIRVNSPAEFWDDNESPIDLPGTKTMITVAPGQTIKNINVILNDSLGRFDQYEDSGELRWLPILDAKPEVRA